jgi:hypothetical protein
MAGGEDIWPLNKTYVFEPKGGKGGKLHKRLGRGSYKAYQFGQRVTVVASGMRPNLQTIVTLETLPMTIFPPQYGLFFTDPDIVSPAMFPFDVEAHFHAEEIIRSVVVYDADGKHDVPVENF